MDEFDALGLTFISRRENVDTSGPMGRLFLTLIGSIAELESDLIRERVLAGMHIGNRRALAVHVLEADIDEGYRVPDQVGVRGDQLLVQRRRGAGNP